MGIRGGRLGGARCGGMSSTDAAGRARPPPGNERAPIGPRGCLHTPRKRGPRPREQRGVAAAVGVRARRVRHVGRAVCGAMARASSPQWRAAQVAKGSSVTRARWTHNGYVVAFGRPPLRTWAFYDSPEFFLSMSGSDETGLRTQELVEFRRNGYDRVCING